MLDCKWIKTKKLRLILLLMAALVMMPSMGGCSNEEPSSDVNGNGQGIKSPVEIKYLVENPISEVPVEEQTDQTYYRSVSITGLKDKAVEQQINDRLAESFEKAKSSEMPPYRGIKRLIPEGSKLMWDNVSMNIYGSFNNVLSVMVNKYAAYAVPDANGTIIELNPGEYRDVQSYSTMDCLNFDLNTGEELRLEDVFTDDTNHPELINKIIGEKLLKSQSSEEGYFDMELYNLKQVMPFTGVVEDQTFFLNNFGLSMVFDYRTPEFETNMQAIAVFIPWTEFSGKAAVTERFYNDSEDLYISEEPLVKTLLPGIEKIDRQEQNFEKIGKVNAYSTASYSSAFPDTVQLKILELYTRDEKEIERLNAALADASSEYIDQNGEAYYELRVSGYSAGRFISVAKEVYAALPALPSQDFSGMRQWREYHCYDKNNGEELFFNDIFKKDYDPSAVIKKAIKTSIQNDVLSYGAGQKLSSEQKDGLLGDENIDMLYNSIQGFSLYTSGMDLSVPAIEIGDSSYLLMISIPYKDFGCDNLLIY